MDDAIDLPALLVAIVISAIIAGSLIVADRGNNHRRSWVVGGIIAGVLALIGVIDLLRETPRETRLVTALFGAAIPVIVALGMVRATRTVRWWARALLVFFTALLFLFAGILTGATLFSALIPI